MFTYFSLNLSPHADKNIAVLCPKIADVLKVYLKVSCIKAILVCHMNMKQ